MVNPEYWPANAGVKNQIVIAVRTSKDGAHLKFIKRQSFGTVHRPLIIAGKCSDKAQAECLGSGLRN
jgi:hypothetical protein